MIFVEYVNKLLLFICLAILAIRNAATSPASALPLSSAQRRSISQLSSACVYSEKRVLIVRMSPFQYEFSFSLNRVNDSGIASIIPLTAARLVLSVAESPSKG